MAQPESKDERVAIRFPVDLLRKLRLLAERERRSLNAQVVHLLERIVRG